MNLLQKLKKFSTSLKLKTKFFYQNKLNSKKSIILGCILLYTPFFIYQAYQHEDAMTLLITKGTQKVSQTQIPKFARSILFGMYSKYYNVNEQQMLKKIQEYKTFSQFFTRKIKDRKIAIQPQYITSPCDGRILSFSEIKQDSCFVVKGYNYSLGHLLCGQQIAFTQQDINKIKKVKQNKLYHVILYLAPGDYHRFHAPTNFQISRKKTIEGFLFPVKEQALKKIDSKVYEKNARLVLHGKWQMGYLGMVLVGALNVGRIVVKDKIQFIKGQEIGYFNLGSTIVLLIEGENIQWKIQEKQKIKYGQVLGKSEKIETMINSKK